MDSIHLQTKAMFVSVDTKAQQFLFTNSNIRAAMAKVKTLCDLDFVVLDDIL